MLGDSKAFSGFSVDDIAKAKAFYGDTLGVPVSEEKGMLLLQIAGDTSVLVHPKENHRPGSFTILSRYLRWVARAVPSTRTGSS